MSDSSFLTALQVSRLYDLEAHYNDLIISDFTDGSGNVFDLTGNATHNMLVSLVAVLAGALSIQWLTKNNGAVTFTADQFKAVALAVIARGQSLFFVYQTKIAEIKALTTEDAVNTYNINTGWS